MVKLTISHAIAQSVKMTLFEELIESTIEDTKHIPQTMSKTGKVQITAITQKIGQLFIVRINVNLVSNVLDTPEIFWSEPTYQPLYSAIRGYLEISQRVELLNQRVSVISVYYILDYDDITVAIFWIC
ncbi:17722_t:CDS:2 [Entrophospora sp. SA101]|nr:17722_t:CDS:2 [Entrophospora sp. SA101]CAJ0885369.1 538_t:CDS:2 [Entrophospora sp. SA101]